MVSEKKGQGSISVDTLAFFSSYYSFRYSPTNQTLEEASSVFGENQILCGNLLNACILL